MTGVQTCALPICVLLPLVFFSVLLPRTAGAPLMVVCYVLAIGIYQFACPSQTDWLVSSVEGLSLIHI